MDAERRAITRGIDQELQKKIEDHEDLLRRKREAQAAAQGHAAEIRRRLNERKRKMAEQNFAGLSEAEKAAMMDRFKAQYESLGF
jgi:septation ring formation regulator EzrA